MITQPRFHSRIKSTILVRYVSNAVKTRSILVKQHIDSGNPTTSEIINEILEKQKVTVSQEDLNGLKKLPSVKFDLPITDQTRLSLEALIGKPQSKSSKKGVYIFTHNATGDKNVGSSNDLARRLSQYFDQHPLFAKKEYGLLIPLMNKQGIGAFSLQVIVVPSSYPVYSHCFLEQYYLLDKSFNLNMRRIVNFRVNAGLNYFLYDLECKILYHSSESKNSFCRIMGIHNASVKKCIDTGEAHLGLFIISNTLVDGAEPSDLTESEVRELLEKRRKENLDKRSQGYGKVVEVFDLVTKETSKYSSVQKAADALETHRASIRTWVKNGRAFQNRYLIKFLDSDSDK